jgi:hypothetical protein
LEVALVTRICAVVCRVGEPARVEMVSPDYEDLSALVGGMVEVAYVSPDVELVCNEEGQYLCPFNRDVPALAPPLPAGFEDAFVIAEPGTIAPGSGQIGVHQVHGNFFLCAPGLRSLSAERAREWAEQLNAIEGGTSPAPPTTRARSGARSE